MALCKITIHGDEGGWLERVQVLQGPPYVVHYELLRGLGGQGSTGVDRRGRGMIERWTAVDSGVDNGGHVYTSNIRQMAVNSGEQRTLPPHCSSHKPIPAAGTLRVEQQGAMCNSASLQYHTAE